MPIPALAAAALASPAVGSAIGAAGNIIGGLLGKSAQKSANKMNYKIAQETNAANERIAEKANALQYKMQQEQFDYASPVRQREMLEAAGMNPYLYGSQSAHAGSAPSVTTGALQVGAQMMPETAFAQGISDAGVTMANIYGTLADARKKQAEATNQEVANEYQVQQITQNLRLLGQEEQARAIELKYKEPKEKVSLDILNQQFRLGEEQILNMQLLNDIQKYYKENIQPDEWNQIKANIDLLKEKKRTEITNQELNRALGVSHLRSSAAAMLNAQVNNYLKESQRLLNEKAAENQAQQAEVNRQVASIKRVYGGKIADAILESTNAGAYMSRAEAKRLYSENEALQRKMQFDEFYQGVKLVQGFLGAAKGMPEFGTGSEAIEDLQDVEPTYDFNDLNLYRPSNWNAPKFPVRSR